MKVVLKPLFEILTGEVAVCDNIIYNYLILIIVGEVAFRIAWNFVGDLYAVGAISGSGSGSIIHWTSRLIIYITIAYTIRFFIWLVEIIPTIPIWVYIAVIFVIISIIVACIIIKKRGEYY